MFIGDIEEYREAVKPDYNFNFVQRLLIILTIIAFVGFIISFTSF